MDVGIKWVIFISWVIHHVLSWMSLQNDEDVESDVMLSLSESSLFRAKWICRESWWHRTWEGTFVAWTYSLTCSLWDIHVYGGSYSIRDSMQDTGDTFSVRSYPRKSLSICSEASEVWLWSYRVQISIRRAIYLVYQRSRIPSAARSEFWLELGIRLFNAIVI